MKQRIRLTESDLHRIVKESVKRILREDEWQEPDYSAYGKWYVAADRESDYFDDYDEAYKYALEIAEEERKRFPDYWEEVHLLDNEKWEPVVIFNKRGIYDLENGTFTPWCD